MDMISCYSSPTKSKWKEKPSIPFAAQASFTFIEVSFSGQMDPVHL